MKTHLKNRLQEMGFPVTSTKDNATAARVIAGLYQEHGAREAARLLQVTKETVRNYTRKHGTARRKRGGANNLTGQAQTQIAWQGKTQTFSAWASEVSISRNVLYARLFLYGYSPERAFTQPVAPRKRRKIQGNRIYR